MILPIVTSLRLVPTRGRGGAVPPGRGRERGWSEARRERRAVDPSPGGSGRYRPALARRRIRRLPLSSRLAPASLPPASGRYRPASSPRWHQPYISVMPSN